VSWRWNDRVIGETGIVSQLCLFLESQFLLNLFESMMLEARVLDVWS